MFKFLAQLFDQSLDKVLEPVEGKPYGQVMGRIGLIMACSLVMLALAGFIATKGRKVEQPQNYVWQEGKAPMRLPVMNNPSLSVEKITTWSSRALRDVFNLRFDNVDSQLRANLVYFEEGAGEDFLASMQKTKMIDKVKSERLFVVLTPMEPPQLVGRGVVGGREVLRIEAPVVITYIGGAAPIYQYQIIELFVRVVPPAESPEGLLIVRLKAHPYNR